MGDSPEDALTLSALPVISIEPFLHPDGHGRLSTAAALHSACSEYGFFYLDISSYIDPSEPEELTRLAREFFALPQDEKDRISIAHEDSARGYQRLEENVTNGKADNHEAIDFYRPVENPDKRRPIWGENQWPTIQGFREKYETWIEKMKNLGMIVMEAMATGLGLTPEEWHELRSKVDDSFWVMRVIGYPSLPNDYDGFSCGAHRDYGCLTFLHADPIPGALQVFLAHPGLLVEKTGSLPAEQEVEDGGHWVNADPKRGCVVCNIGEMWEVWSNGIYKSTLHRVVHKGSDYRVSIPFFFEPNFDARIEPLPTALRAQEEDRSLRGIKGVRKTYQPVVYGEFLLKKVGTNFDTGKGRYDGD